MLDRVGARPLFGAARDVGLWSGRLERGDAVVERWERGKNGEAPNGAEVDTNPLTTLLPLAVVRGGIPAPYREGLGLSRGDQLWAVISRHDRRAADEWLASRGLRPAARGETDGASTDDGDGVDVA